MEEHGKLYVMEELIAGLTTRLVYLLGELYDRADYIGPVDIALAVTGIYGARALGARNVYGSQSSFPPYDRPEYRKARRVSALTLKNDARSMAQYLVMPLVRATTQGRYDPFEN
jgi:hypothetical protein